jgi:YD repeat-containing protein
LVTVPAPPTADGLNIAEESYDGLGRLIQSRQYLSDSGCSDYTVIDRQYDAAGRTWKVSNPYCHATQTADGAGWTATQYDELGRVRYVTAPDLSVTETQYGSDGVGLLATVTDPAGKQRRFRTDALGRVQRVQEMLTGGSFYVTDHAYDTLGNLTNVNQGSQAREFRYDSLSRLRCASNPETRTSSGTCNGTPSGVDVYSYDAAGNLQTHTDPRGVTTTFGYDELNRVTSKTYSDGTTPGVTLQYDTDQTVTLANDPSQIVSDCTGAASAPIGRLTATTVAAHSDDVDQSFRSHADQIGAKRRRALSV